MNITIIGASAGIGLLTVEQALDRGHRVTAFSRSTALIPDHPSLIKLNGNATSVADLKQAVSGADAVLVTIGTKDKRRTTLFSETAQALIRACTEHNASKPVLVVTGFGAGDSRHYLSFFMRLVIRLFLRDQYEDKTRMEVLFAQSNLRWEMVRPGRLTNGAPTQTYRVLPELHKGIRVSKITRADVADFLLNQAEKPTLIGQHVSLTE